MLSPDEAKMTLRVGYPSDDPPYAMIDSEGTPYGPALELIKYFAYERGYALDLFESVWPMAMAEVPSGKMDVFLAMTGFSEDGTIVSDNPGLIADFTLLPVDFVLVTRADTVLEGYELIEYETEE